jgi:hypothetical protein
MSDGKRREKVPPLLAAIDVAIRWGVSKQVANSFMKRQEDFPEPVVVVANGKTPLYLESEIEEFEKTPEFIVWHKKFKDAKS